MSLPRPAPPRQRTVLRRVAAVVLFTALFATLTVVAPEDALADRDRNAEAWLTAAIDRERVERGLQRLETASDVADVAAAWSARMAAREKLAHNPSYGDQICCWKSLSENVAMASGIEFRGGLEAALRDVHRQLMGSSPHRANILNPNVNEVGVGVYIANDTLWVTQNFRHRAGTTTPPTPSSPPSTSSGGDGGNVSSGSTTVETRTSRPTVDIRAVQRHLADLGWYLAEVDGVVGPATLDAVTSFQRAVGLEPAGSIDTETLAALTADDPPHRSGAGGWAHQVAAFDALRQRALEIRSREDYPAAAVEEHPVIVVLDRIVAAQSP